MRTWLCMSARKSRFPVGLQIATVAVLLLCTVFAWGQATNTGTVIGIISDPSGAVVPGVTITLTDVNTKAALTTTTNDAGRYVFVNVPPGTYDITASKSGFAVGKIAAQSVRVGSQTNGNIQLSVGQQQQVVEVQATGTELQTLNATVGNTVTGVALSSLPSLGRDVSTFATLQPGVSPDGSVAGTVVDQSSFQLDGGNNTNDMDGSMNVYTPSFAGDPTGGLVGGASTGVMPTPADSVEEFKVNTANQTADFNNSSGMQVQVVTKRGTNTFHGSVYEYYLDNNWNANTWDNNHTKTPIPGYHYSRFGVSAGGPVLPEMLGGKTYLFGNYQGFRWPNSSTFERTVPTASMRAGLLKFGGNTYDVKSTTVDPRGIGISPVVAALFSKLPLPNDFSCTLSRCDNVNVAGFKGNLALPQNDNFGVVRLDHDFGARFHFMSSYRYYHLLRAATSQIDITNGVMSSTANRPQVPWYLVYGLTTNITPNITNDIHYSYLRNFWSWSTKGAPPQVSGTTAAIEPFGESATNVLSNYNVNTQNVRTRFWDGQDHLLRDDLTWLKGNHLMQFGGSWQRNWDWHQRTDNGGGINYYPVYQLGISSGAGISITNPSTLPSSSSRNYGRDVAALLGAVSIAQQAYTRTGANLALNPPLTPAFDQDTIPFYNFYATDTWHMKPSLTLTYGLGWTLELPPTEAQHKFVEVTDATGKPIDTVAYLNARKSAALQGQVYNPIIGFTLLDNVPGKPKYPYNTYYGSFSPRVAVAWNPKFGDSMFGKVFGGNNTVIRGGYGRIYGRLNGVDLVLVPLLAPGFIQPVQCVGALRTGGCGGANLSNVFRIGVDGSTAPLPPARATLPQPLIPGVNDVAAGAGEGLDPNFRPNVTDTFTFSIQRQVGAKATLEVGYIGRRITHEYQPININAVPHMMTLGGQSFAKAYAAIEVALGCAKSQTVCSNAVAPASMSAQPFFEAALGGPSSAYCKGFANCTTAVVNKEIDNFTSQSVWSLWSDLDSGAFTFPRSMLNTPLTSTAPCPGSTSTSPCGANGQLSSGVGINAAIGYGNYNAGYFTIKTNNWHGFTTQQNFTWSKALGTGAEVQATSEYTADDPFNLSTMYGPQPWDRKFVYNVFLVYETPWYKNQAGVVGRLLGGWNFAPVFAAGTGSPNTIWTVNGQSQAFGSGDGSNFFDNENLIPTGPIPASRANYNVAGAGGLGLNIFKNPSQVFDSFRPPILGLDTRAGGAGPIRGMNYWNMDLALRKRIRFTERINFEFSTIFTNVFNHPQFYDPNASLNQLGNLDASSPDTFGNIPGQPSTNPRSMEFGLRVNW